MSKAKVIYAFDCNESLIKCDTMMNLSTFLGLSYSAVKEGLRRGGCVAAKYFFSEEPTLKRAKKRHDHSALSQTRNRQTANYKDADMYFRDIDYDSY